MLPDQILADEQLTGPNAGTYWPLTDHQGCPSGESRSCKRAAAPV
jgi:hypothetical protein